MAKTKDALETPVVLTRADFDSDEEYREYLDIEAAVDPVEPLSEERRAWWRQVAHNTMNPKKKRISILVSENVLTKLRARAMEEGIPYQTLINSILHKHVDRR